MDAGGGFDAGPPMSDCFDGRQNGDETDRDCGGSCPACRNGQDCVEGTDCRSGACINAICAVPSCNDGVQNQDETDIDCGGSECEDRCPEESRCMEDTDCSSNSCRGGQCAEPACDDGRFNGRETDVDCGGPICDGCATGQMCGTRNDCVDLVCTDGSCAAPACDDNIHNGDETDRDCGGSLCRGCRDRQMCNIPEDCGSGVCTGGMCEGNGEFEDDFEAGTTFQPGWNTPAPPWFITMSTPINGMYSAESANISDGQSTTLELAVDCGAPGMVTFAYRVSSEACCDRLRFYVDGIQQSGADWRGTAAGTAMYALPMGTHTLRWTYSKDFSISTGSDNALIDDVVTMNCNAM